MSSFGAHVSRRKQEPSGDLLLDTQVPLLNVTATIVSAIDLGDRLHDLRKKLLRATRPKTASRRRRDAIREGQRDRIIRMSSIHSPGVGCTARINHVIDRVQSKRDVVGHPENSIAAANDGCWRQAISQPDPRREVVPLKRKIVPCSMRHQIDIALNCWRTFGKKLVQVARRVGNEIREPVKTLRPRPLQLITESKTHCQSVFDMPDVVEVDGTIRLLSRSKCRDNCLRKEMVFEIAEVIRIS